MKLNNLLNQFNDENCLTLAELNKTYDKYKKEINQQLRHLKKLRSLGRKAFKSLDIEEQLSQLRIEEKDEQNYSRTLSTINKDIIELDKSYIELRNKIKTQESADDGIDYELGG